MHKITMGNSIGCGLDDNAYESYAALPPVQTRTQSVDTCSWKNRYAALHLKMSMDNENMCTMIHPDPLGVANEFAACVDKKVYFLCDCRNCENGILSCNCVTAPLNNVFRGRARDLLFLTDENVIIFYKTSVPIDTDSYFANIVACLPMNYTVPMDVKWKTTFPTSDYSDFDCKALLNAVRTSFNNDIEDRIRSGEAKNTLPSAPSSYILTMIYKQLLHGTFGCTDDIRDEIIVNAVKRYTNIKKIIQQLENIELKFVDRLQKIAGQPDAYVVVWFKKTFDCFPANPNVIMAYNITKYQLEKRNVYSVFNIHKFENIAAKRFRAVVPKKWGYDELLQYKSPIVRDVMSNKTSTPCIPTQHNGVTRRSREFAYKPTNGSINSDNSHES